MSSNNAKSRPILLIVALVGFLLDVGLAAVVAGLGEQPCSNVVDYGLQAVVTDAFAVARCHRLIDMAHNQIERRLVSAFPADRFENVPQSVEPPPFGM